MGIESAAQLLVALVLGVASIEVSHKSRNVSFLRSGEQIFLGEDRCSFRAYLDDGQRTIVASTENIVFESDGVLVVQEESARIMVFLTPGTILNLWKPKCGQQAVVECGPRSAQLVSAQKEKTKVACGSRNMCAPRSVPDLSYMRSMIGGALVHRKGEFQNIASIGVGAGSIPLWLSKMLPTAHVEAVDVSAAVIAAAPCFGLPNSPNLKLVHDDGRNYLSGQVDERYDVVFVDVFVQQDDAIPTCFKTVEFYKMVKKKLAPGGVIVLNIAAAELSQITSSLRQAFSHTSKIWIGKAPGLSNSVVLARAPGGLQEEPGTTGENAEGFAAAQIWASQANFQVLTTDPATQDSQPLHDNTTCSM